MSEDKNDVVKLDYEKLLDEIPVDVLRAYLEERGVITVGMYEYYTTDEIAELLRVSTMTVKRLAASGKLSAAKVGAQWRISKDEFEKYMESVST